MTVTTAANPFLPNEIAFDIFRGLQGLVGIETNLMLNLVLIALGCRCQRPDSNWHSGYLFLAWKSQDICIYCLL